MDKSIRENMVFCWGNPLRNFPEHIGKVDGADEVCLSGWNLDREGVSI